MKHMTMRPSIYIFFYHKNKIHLHYAKLQKTLSFIPLTCVN